MKKTSLIFLVCMCAYKGFSQDSLKTITHEAGVNIFSLLKQVNLFTPPAEQLPYDVFYNVYYKRVGVRTGLGINNNWVETDIEGQQLPRLTTMENINLRLGASYYLVHYKKISINIFADYVWHKRSLESSTTSTIQVFPNPVTTRVVQSTDITEGKGGQGGLGLTVHINRHLALYTETPITYLAEKQSVEDLIRETGEEDVKTGTTTRSAGIKIALPVTVYLVFRI